MFLLPASDLYVLLDDAPLAAPEDVLVLLPHVAAQAADAPEPTLPVDAVAPAADPAPPLAEAVAPSPAAALPPATPDAVPDRAPPAEALATSPPAPPADPAPAAAAMTAETPAPAFDLPPEDAFPSLAALDAILAAHAGPPPGPDAAERAEVAALLGLDPAIAADADLYAGIIANLPDPDADAMLETWLSEAEAGSPPPEWPEPAGDWQVG